MAQESESLLAKLLAEEDLTIVHNAELSRAEFNLNRRILSLPIYNEMEGDIFDGMMAREVASALWTPPKEYETALSAIEKAKPEYMQVLKMVESHRTESNMKIKFAGLSSTFSKMYMDFWDKGYFNINGVINDLGLVDRLNIHSKVPWIDVEFDAYEDTFREDLDAVSTFEDSMTLTRDIIEYLVNKQIEFDEQEAAKNAPPEEPEEPEEIEEDKQDPEEPEENNSDDNDTEETDEELDEDQQPDDSDDDTSSDEQDGESDSKPDEEPDEDEIDDEESDQTSTTDEDEESEDGESEESGSDGESEDGESGDESDNDDSTESDNDDSEESGSESDDSTESDSGCETGDESESDSGETAESDSESELEPDSEGSESGEESADNGMEDGDQDSSEITDGDSSDGASDGDELVKPPEISTIDQLENAISDNEVNSSGNIIQNMVVPEIVNPDKHIDRIDVVHEHWNKIVAMDSKQTQHRINYSWDKFKTDEKRTVDYMLQLFNMRKNAAELRRTRTAKSGRLDLKKLAFYKTSEDIFKSTTLVSDGTNHGVALVLDFSYSMKGVRMYQTLRQALVMIMFCQMAKIPFVVYGFTNICVHHYKSNKAMPDIRVMLMDTPKVDYVDLGGAHVRELISSDHPIRTQKMIMRNLYREAMSHSGAGIKCCEQLNGTPTNQTMLILSQKIRDWKNKRNIEIMNTMLMTDGESTSLTVNSNQSYHVNRSVIMQDQITRKRYTTEQYEQFPRESAGHIHNKMVYDMFRERSGSSLIVMFISNARSLIEAINIYFPPEKRMAAMESLKKDGNAANDDYMGTDRMVFSLDKDTSNDMDLSGDNSIRKIENQFIKQSKNILQSKVLSSILLDVISNNL